MDMMVWIMGVPPMVKTFSYKNLTYTSSNSFFFMIFPFSEGVDYTADEYYVYK